MRKVVWDKVAYQSLRRIYKFIQRDSPANAEKVKNGLLKATHSLAKNPFRHLLDRCKQNNLGDYLRLRHVKQEPLTH
jgi:hypothetical protein